MLFLILTMLFYDVIALHLGLNGTPSEWGMACTISALLGLIMIYERQAQRNKASIATMKDALRSGRVELGKMIAEDRRRAGDMASEHDDDLYTIACPLCRHKSQAKYEDVSGHQCPACGFVNGEYWNAAEAERNG